VLKFRRRVLKIRKKAQPLHYNQECAFELPCLAIPQHGYFDVKGTVGLLEFRTGYTN